MKKRILIVEDNIALSHIQKDWLEREGYSVATAMNEPFAHKLLRKEQFDLILSDVRLPQGDGIHLLEWIGKEKMTCLLCPRSSVRGTKRTISATSWR